MVIVIDSRGVGRCLYSEAIDLAALGQLVMTRASHVEPTLDGRWTADLSPVAGPVLGPFAKRSEALVAEAAWLESHRITCSLDAC